MCAASRSLGVPPLSFISLAPAVRASEQLSSSCVLKLLCLLARHFPSHVHYYSTACTPQDTCGSLVAIAVGTIPAPNRPCTTT